MLQKLPTGKGYCRKHMSLASGLQEAPMQAHTLYMAPSCITAMEEDVLWLSLGSKLLASVALTFQSYFLIPKMISLNCSGSEERYIDLMGIRPKNDQLKQFKRCLRNSCMMPDFFWDDHIPFLMTFAAVRRDRRTPEFLVPVRHMKTKRSWDYQTAKVEGRFMFNIGKVVPIEKSFSGCTKFRSPLSLPKGGGKPNTEKLGWFLSTYCHYWTNALQGDQVWSAGWHAEKSHSWKSQNSHGSDTSGARQALLL